MQLLYQMWFYCLSKLTHRLVPGMQLLICQMPFSQSLSTRSNRSRLLLPGKVSNIIHHPTSGMYQFSSPVSLVCLICTTFLFCKISHWSIKLMTLCWLDLVSKKQHVCYILTSTSFECQRVEINLIKSSGAFYLLNFKVSCGVGRVGKSLLR